MIIYLHFLDGHLTFAVGIKNQSLSHLEAEVLLVNTRDISKTAKSVAASAAHLVGEGIHIVEPHLFGHILTYALALGNDLYNAAVTGSISTKCYCTTGRIKDTRGRVVVSVLHNAIKSSNAGDFNFEPLFQLFDD